MEIVITGKKELQDSVDGCGEHDQGKVESWVGIPKEEMVQYNHDLLRVNYTLEF